MIITSTMFTVNREKLLQVSSLLLGFIYFTTAQTCDSTLRQSCYKFFTGDTQSWENAAQTCRNWDKDAHLISITDREEQDVIVQEMKDRNINSMWLGGREKHTDWRWITDNTFIQLQGCFVYDETKNIFTQVEKGVDVIPSTCVQKCKSQQKKYAALYVPAKNDEVVCLCGDRYSNYNSTNLFTQTIGCTVPCKKSGLDPVPYCGGHDKMHVYRATSDTDNYNRWYRDQPNNWSPYQECMALIGTDHKWGDEACHKGENFICQYKMSMSECKNAGHIFEANTCFHTYTTKRNWFEARHECEKKNGKLLKMSSSALHAKLKTVLTNENWWIGGTNRRWTWPDGEVVLYSAWAEKVPNNPLHECMLLNQDAVPGYRWDDEDCQESHAFVCEKDSSTTLPTTIRSTTTKSATTSKQPTTTKRPATKSPTKSTAPPSTPTPIITDSSKTPSKQAPSTIKFSVADSSTTSKPTTPTKEPTEPTNPEKTNPAVRTNSQGQPITRPTTGPGTTNLGVATTPETEEPGMRASKPNELLLPIGVIVAIAVACIAVVAAFIRLVVYCVTHRRVSTGSQEALAEPKKNNLNDQEDIYENDYSRAPEHAHDNHINEMNSSQDTITRTDSEVTTENKGDTPVKKGKKKGGMDWAY